MSFAAESPSSPESDEPLGDNSKPPAQVDEPFPEAWASLLETSEVVEERVDPASKNTALLSENGEAVPEKTEHLPAERKLPLLTLDIRQLALIVAAVLV